MRHYSLRDDQWDRIRDFLPGREGHVGSTAETNRLFVEAGDDAGDVFACWVCAGRG